MDVVARFRRRGRSVAEGSPAPFVVGVPRSGTTLLRLMLDAHPQLAIPAETHFVPDLIRMWRRMTRVGAPESERRSAAIELITHHARWGDLGIAAEELREQLARADRLRLADVVRAIYLVHARQQGKPRWGDKTPQYITDMARIQGVLPEACFVNVIRDGRDVALSMREVSWATDDVDEAARRWVRRITVARRDAARLRPDSYLEVRYEHLVAEPDVVLRKVAEAVALPWDDAMLAYHERAGERMANLARELHSEKGRTITQAERERQHALVSSPPRQDRVARWRREMAPAHQRRFVAIAGELLEELGYPVREDVSSSDTPSRYSDDDG